MREWPRKIWRKVRTQPCGGCGEPVVVGEYRETGRTRKGTWWAGGAAELECPRCGHTFWVKG